MSGIHVSVLAAEVVEVVVVEAGVVVTVDDVVEEEARVSSTMQVGVSSPTSQT